jgi:acylphosphatase
MAPKRVHVLVSGLVQGVNFRYYTLLQANRLGVRGWVRNLHDGRVEAVFEGEQTGIDEIVNWCHTGPRSARVERVDTLPETYVGEFDGFEIE